MKQLFTSLMKEWDGRELPTIKNREVDLDRYIDFKVKKIVPIVGFRRVGKTYLLYSIAKKYGKENVVYVNFEDERIPKSKLRFNDFYLFLKEYAPERKFLLLDEIQEIPNWSKWLRTLNDTTNYLIFATGSSSKLSSREIPTELRGRTLTITLWPLSFREFLDFKGVDKKEISKWRLLKYLKEYVKFGGFPEVVLVEEGKKYMLIDEYLSTFTLRDIFERYNIRNKEAMRTLMRILLNSTYVTISKSHNTLKSLGFKIGKATLSNYFFYLNQTFFLEFLEIFSPSIKKSLQVPRKVYFVDNFFLTRYSTRFSENFGRLIENLVFLELKRRQSSNPLLEIYYWKDYQQREVDFLVKEGLRVKQLIQVTYASDKDEIEKRELKSLLKAAELFKKDKPELIVITWDYEDEQKIDEKKIRFIPLWKWLLFLNS